MTAPEERNPRHGAYNSMQRTALLAAADAERSHRHAAILPFLVAAALMPAAPVVAGRRVPAPEPPRLPADRDAASLFAALPADEREKLDGARKVVTFAEEEQESAAGYQVLAVSLGTLDLSPAAVRSVLAATEGYPDWVTLSPTYKGVRVVSPARMACDVGRSEARHGREELVYDVAADGPVVAWTLARSTSPLLPGSWLSYEAAPHPARPGATLVVHRQLARLPDKGRLTRYLDSEDDHGRNRFWKDASKHARRLHWAIDAAAREPAGGARRSLYLDHHRREFPASTPWWAK